MNLVAISIVYEFLQSPDRDARASKVLQVSQYMRDALAKAGFAMIAKDGPICPVICLRMERPRELSAWLQDKGFHVTPVTFPIVPRGTDRLRICLHAGNTHKEVDTLILRLQEYHNQAKL